MRRGCACGLDPRRGAAAVISTTRARDFFRRPLLEPSWHRRQRRARGQARLLVRLGSAAGLLSAHHSAQRQPGMQQRSNGARGAKGNPPGGRAGDPAVLPGPRAPLWSCGPCGKADNWACRVARRGCGRDAPRRIQAAARTAAQVHLAKVDRGQMAGRPVGTRSPEAERIGRLEEEVRQLRAAARVHSQVPAPPSPSPEDDKSSTDAVVEKLRAEIQALEGIDGAEQLLGAKRDRLRALQQERLAAKPVHQQLRDLQGKLDRKEKALQRRIDVELPALAKAAQEARDAHAKAQLEAETLRAEISNLQAQLVQVLAAQNTSRLPREEEAWNKAGAMLHAIRDAVGEGPVRDQIVQLGTQLHDLFEKTRPPAAGAEPDAMAEDGGPAKRTWQEGPGVAQGSAAAAPGAQVGAATAATGAASASGPSDYRMEG